MNIKKRWRLITVLGLIICGTGSSLLNEFINFNRKSYPLFQTQAMFIGEFLCFIFIFFNKAKREPHNCSPLVKKYGDYCFFLSGFFDFLCSLVQSICAAFLNFPFYLTLKMLTTIYVLIYRKLYVNRSMGKHQTLGILIYIIGMIIIIFEVLFDRNDNQFE